MIKNKIEKVKSLLVKRGPLFLLKKIIATIFKKPLTILGNLYYPRVKDKGEFVFQSKSYDYFFHPYNSTWKNERMIEMPIFLDYLNNFSQSGGKILEVGNVLSHYSPIPHRVIDKYEKASGVENIDALDFEIDERFAAILSISTFEHVGWDEEDRDTRKIIRLLDHLKKFLAPGGKIIFSIPIGFNPPLDQLLKNGEIKLDQQFHLVEVSSCHWEEKSSPDFYETAYEGYPFFSAKALLIGVIKND